MQYIVSRHISGNLLTSQDVLTTDAYGEVEGFIAAHCGKNIEAACIIINYVLSRAIEAEYPVSVTFSKQRDTDYILTVRP